MGNGEICYRLFIEGDEEAFDEIMREYFDGLIFFINRYVKDIYAAEDIAIDVFAYVAANRKAYNFKVSLKTYLFMIGRSRALNYIKHRKRIEAAAICDTESLISEQTAIEDTVLSDEKKHRVNDALLKLPDAMRLAVHLVYFEELSYEEAARVMKKNKKQIDNLLYRAKSLLRSELGKEYDLI